MDLKELKEQLILQADVINDEETIRIISKEENTDDNEECIWVSDVLVFSRPNDKFLIRNLHKDNKKEHIITDSEGVVFYFKGWNDACDNFLSSVNNEEEKSEIYIKSYLETMEIFCKSERQKLEKLNK